MQPGQYRSPSPPQTTTVRLETHDVGRLRRAVFLFCGSFFVVIVLLSFGIGFLPKDYGPIVFVLMMLLVAVGFIVGLVTVIKRTRELRFILEMDAARVRLLAPNGTQIADTAGETLGFVKINYTRRGRHGSAWLRPGFRMRHPNGSHLVGTLLPELAWDHVEHDPEMPEFELRPPEFAVLVERFGR